MKKITWIEKLLVLVRRILIAGCSDESKEVYNANGWGLVYGGIQPMGKVDSEYLARFDSYYIGSDSKRVVYLTFDCGYENGNTELILDVLKRHDAKGTFFMTGKFLETAPELVNLILKEGHETGNHTWDHPDMSALTDKADFQEELEDVEKLFYKITGKKIGSYYRPPEGKFNEEKLKWAKEMGYHTIFWALAYRDWEQDNQPDPQESIELLSSRISPGAIVLLHNTSKTNGIIIDDLLTRWEDMGYSFQLLSHLINS